MEELSGTVSRDESPRQRTRRRRRSHTRRSPLSCNIINMAEARKQIVNALQLHRSSSSSKNVDNSTTSRSITHSGLFNNIMDQSMPAPEPFGEVPTTALELDESFEDNASSSYSWWMGFLKSLDSNSEEVTMWNNCYKEGFLGNLDDVEKSADQCEDVENNATEDDDWLIFTASDDEC